MSKQELRKPRDSKTPDLPTPTNGPSVSYRNPHTVTFRHSLIASLRDSSDMDMPPVLEASDVPGDAGDLDGGPSNFFLVASGDKARDWDFISARPQYKTTTILEAIGHLVKNSLGGGILAIHETYTACGLWTALALNIIIGCIVGYFMYARAKSAQIVYGRCQIHTLSYPALAEAALSISPWTRVQKFSRIFRYLLNLLISVYLFGSCCVYQVIIARTIKQFLEDYEQVNLEGNPNLRVYVVCLFIPCMLIAWLTTLEYLAPFSIVVDFVIVALVLSTVYFAVYNAEKSPFELPIFNSFPGLFEFMGALLFSVEGVPVVLAIENHMADPKKIGVVVASGMTIMVILVMVVGSFGSYGYAEKATSPVTIHFPFHPFPMILKLFVAIMVYVMFGLNFWIPFDLIWNYLRELHPVDKHWFWERLYRTVMVMLVTMVSVMFPNISSFIGLLGSLCLSNISLIFPAFIELCLDWEEPGLGFMKWRLLKFIGTLIFGVTLCVFGTFMNGAALMKSFWFKS